MESGTTQLERGFGMEGHTKASSRNRKTRLIWFRLSSILIGLSFFPLLEFVCFVADIGHPSTSDDPFVGFKGIRPLFTPSEDGSLWETSRARLGFFAPQSFTASKSADEFRIFVFGGSTVQGNPFQPETSFTTFLEQALNVASPGRRWRVINCGGISYASYRLVPIMQECLQYEPDLYIFCEGHNEFLEDITYSEVRESSDAIAGVYSSLSRFRSFRLLSSLLKADSESPYQPLDPNHPVLPMEVDALLDHQGGLEHYHRDDQHADAVVRHFQGNIERIADICSTSKVPLLILKPPCNLSDCPPFKSQYAAGISPEKQATLTSLLDEASVSLATNPEASVNLLKQAVQLDERFAFSWYHLGHALLACYRVDEAQTAFVRARDEDVCPLRMTSALERALEDAVESKDLDFIDTAELLQQHSTSPIPGDGLLVDHIHPSFEGHQLIALRIVDWMSSKSLADLQNRQWRSESERQFREHVGSLDDIYFLRGRRALRDLQGWAAGRATKPK
ncbi:MAG: SGNH/GDSL hydrolase family protein [Planctomyces sp.]|nr:SGNH/GDSL hydrolase family protein [Planctomyces sp.]